VFGIPGEGYKFVYVFDRSGSMGGSGRSALSAAKAELLASLESLEKTHQFQIIFYNDRPTKFNPTGNPDRLVFATERNKALARRFVASITAEGGTRHEEALIAAIKLQPDVIFFLTDADEPKLWPDQLARIHRMAAGITIHGLRSMPLSSATVRSPTRTTFWCVWRGKTAAGTPTWMFRAWRRPDASRFGPSRQEKIACQCVFEPNENCLPSGNLSHGAHRVPVESSSGAVRRRARGAHGSRSVLLGGVVGLIVAVVGICSAEWAAAQDTITVLTDAGAETRLGGRVVEFYGGQLLLMLPGGRQRSIPAEKVLKIETQYTASYAAAEKAFLARRFDQALTLYRRALEEEPRRWVRRQTLARMVWCYRALDRWMEAGQTFLLLWQSDPQTPYFDCIPLCWVPRQPSAELEQSARNWLAGPEPVKILLGASHLVNTAARQQALAQLARLTAAEDRRIALLAAAQGCVPDRAMCWALPGCASRTTSRRPCGCCAPLCSIRATARWRRGP